MCAQIEALQDVAAAARALTDACMCRMDAIAATLRHAYQSITAEPLPAEMVALVDRLDPDQSKR